MQVKISNVEVIIAKNSLSIDDSIGERSTCSFTVVDKESINHYQKGQQVSIYEGTTLVFAGVIDKSVEQKISHIGLYHSITCADWHYLADKRVIAKAYENVTSQYIVNDIITSYLSIEGVTVGNIVNGADITEAVFNYVSITQALDELAEKTGYIWYIDFDKKLYFMPRSTYVAPWTLTNININGTARVEHGNSKYRNKQYIKGGRDITDPMTQKFKGDGNNKSFVCGFPLAKVPTIKVNNILKTVGIKNLDSNKDFYWAKGDSIITHADSATALTTTDILEVTYQGEFSFVAITFSTGEIEDRKTIENNSGIVEEVTDDLEVSSREAAFQSANAKLKKYAVIGRRLQFPTIKSGLKTGQLLTVNLPEHNLINVQMLIESIVVSNEDNTVYYNVTCAEGPEQNSWAKMFEAMAQRGQAFIIRQNISEKQVLIVYAPFSKTWNISDTPNIFKEVYASDTLYPSSTLYPMFEFTDRVKYIELLDASNNVLLRKKVTKQTGTTTENINSITYIAPFEANSSIAKVRWYGGRLTTDVNGTGILINEQPYIKVKNQLEAIQIDRTDSRNFTPMTGTLKLTVEYFQVIDDKVQALLNNSL